MPPVGAFIATLITSASVAAASAAFVAAGGWLAVGTFILTQVVLWGVGKLLAPKQNRGGERQADTLTLSLGENPREAVFGQVATGGQLVDCWNHDSGNGDGRKNRAEVLVIKLADHEVDSLVGFYVNDEYYAFAGDGDVSAFYISGWGPGLQVYFRAGTQTQTPPSAIVSTSGGKWTNAKTMLGCAHVFVRYFDNKERTIFPGGRPRFSWVVKGAKLYDPRKDSTVAGGSGAHRWGTPSTYEWSENAYLIRYNWARGIYNGSQLMVGRGLTVQEAPPDRAISRANICDEAVTLKAGGTEPRYRAGGVIKSSDASIDVEEWLAAAMAGLIVDRDGVVDIDPGAAQSTVFSITDADMIAGREIQYSPHLNENQRLNTVVARWIDPAQRYADVSTAPRKVSADITADGRPYDVTIDLPFVLSGTQAQRIAEIRRRQGRLERVFSIPLGPKFIGLETGDWLAVQSDRYLGGATITGVATAVSLGDDFQVQVAIREINSNVYAWTAASDEQTKGTVLAASTAAPGAIVVDTFTATAGTLTTSAGTDPAIYCTWLSFEDGAVSGIEFQVRKNGDTKITTTLVEDTTSLEAFVTSGVGAQGSFDIRARGVSRVPGRTSTWTSWTTVTTGGSSYDNDAVRVGGQNLFTKAQWRAATYAAGASFVESGVANGVSGWGLTISATNPDFAIATTATRSWLSGQDITISFIAWRTSGANPAYLEVDLYPDTLPGTGFNVTNVPQKFTWTFSSTHADMASAALRFFSDVTATIRVTDIMVERGNKNSDWVPAPGDSDNALVPAGNANRVRYARMEAGTLGYGVLYNPSALSNTPAAGVYLGRGLYKTVATFTASNQTISVGTNIGVQPIPVRAGERLAVQIGVEGLGPTGTMNAMIAFLDDANVFKGQTYSPVLYGGQTYGTPLQWFSTVPTGATKAWIELYYTSSGAGTGTLTLVEPSVTGALPNQTVFPDFVTGPGSEAGANVTETRTAAAIAGQADWATYTGINTSNMAGRVSYLDTGGNLASLDRVTDKPLSKVTGRAASLIPYADSTSVEALKPGEAGANVTESRTAAAIAGQGALATKSAVNLATSDVTNKSLANLDGTANTKLSGIEAGATVGAAWGSNLTGRPANLSPLTGAENINNALVSGFANALMDSEFLVSGSSVGNLYVSGGTWTQSIVTTNQVRTFRRSSSNSPAATQVNIAHAHPYGISVSPGERIELSGILTWTNMSSAYLFGVMFDASLAYMGDLFVVNGSNGNRVGGFATIPSGCRFITFGSVGITNTASVSTTLDLAQPFMRKASADQTTLSPYVPGPSIESGANVTETRVASAIAGQGALATRGDVLLGTHLKDSGGTVMSDAALKNALIPAGEANRVRYSRMERGAVGYGVLYNPSGLANTPSSGVYLGRALYKTIPTFTASGQYISIGTNRYTNPIPVRAGERLAVQIGVEATGAAIGATSAKLMFVDASDAFISSIDSSVLTGTQAYGTMLQWFGTVPANAVNAWIELYFMSSSSGTGNCTIIEPMVCGASALQTVFPSFSPGSGAEAGADITSTNTAAAITGQGSLATRGDVLIGTHLKDSAGTVRLDDDLLNVRAGFAPRKTWWFESGDEGWTGGNGSVAAANGLLTLTPSTTDAQIISPASSPNLLGRLIPKVRVRARLVSGSTAWEGNLYYSTAGHSWSGSYYKQATIPPGWTANQWCVVEFDMTALTAGGSDWVSNTITGLRVDLSNASNSVIEYDWISVGDYSSDPVTTRGIADNADVTRQNDAAGLRPGATLIQSNGVRRAIINSVEEYTVQDGDTVTFATAYATPPRMRVMQGGKRVDSSLAATQVQADSAVISTTGATVALKLKNTVGTVTGQSQTTWTNVSSVRREADKPTSADAWDNAYSITVSASVVMDKSWLDNEVYPSVQYYYGYVEVTAYTNDGSGWVARGSTTLDLTDSDNSLPVLSRSATKTGTQTGTITFSAGAIGQHAGKEFAVEITYRSNASSVFNGSNNATYGTAGAPTTAARTTSAEKVVVRFEQGAEV